MSRQEEFNREANLLVAFLAGFALASAIAAAVIQSL